MPVVLLVALVAGLVYVDHRAGEVRRVDVASDELTPVAGQPFNILVVGTDGPRGQAGARTDTIMVVHVDEAAKRVGVLSIPRDLVFDDSGPRINSLLGTGGPASLIDAVRDQLGIDVSHYVEIDEPGLADLVDAVGGIQVSTSAPMRDVDSGLELQSGCNRLDGEQAVALVRSRHLAVATGGDPVVLTFDPTGDLGRQRRQQELTTIIGRRLMSMPVDSSSFSTLLDVFADHTTVDTGFGRSDLLDLARWGHGLDATDITTSTLPVTPFVNPSGGDVLRLTSDSPRAVASFLRGDAPPSQPVTTSPSVSITACS